MMYTIVKHPYIIDRRRSVRDPRPEIIDHRDGGEDAQRWTQKMKKDENTYKHLKKHRNELLESELVYKKMIKELEKEKEELMHLYEPTYQENKVLKSVLQHGPDAVKMKKLHKARKELQEEVEQLKEENNNLTGQMADIVKKHKPARDLVLEKNWADILSGKAKKKKKKENVTEDSTLVKGVVSTSDIARSLFEKKNIEEQDMYDLELDNVEKEIQMILNNVKYLKQQKRQVDYALVMEKGAVVKNSPLESAIFETLDKDLKAFKGNVINAKKKNDTLKQQLADIEAEAQTKEQDEKKPKKKQKAQNEVIDETKDKVHKTIETQTDDSLHQQNPEPRQSKSHKKPFIAHHTTRAVQTDLKEENSLRNSSIQSVKLNDNHEKERMEKKWKIKDSKKVSSTKLALEYAKKLVIKTDLPNSVEPSSEQVITETKQDIVMIDGAKRGKNQKRKEHTIFECLDSNGKYSNFKQGRTNSNKTKSNSSGAKIRSSSVEDSLATKFNNHLYSADNKPIYPKRPSEQFFKRTKSTNRAVVSKRLTLNSLRASTRPRIRAHFKSPFIVDTQTAIDQRSYVERETNESTPVNEFRLSIPWKDSNFHFKGHIEIKEEVKRDESAYDEVLFGLKEQYKLQGGENDVNKEFQKQQVQIFGNYKENVGESQKLKRIDSPNAPITFSAGPRTLTAREVRSLMME